MSPEALSELISSIAHNLVAAGQAGALTDELIPPVDKLAVMRPRTVHMATGPPTSPCSWPRRPA